MLKKTISILLLISIFLFTGCGSDKKDQTKVANNMLSSNEYVLTALDSKQYVIKKEGSGFVLQGAKGKVVIFDIFATWCPPCRAAASHLSSLQAKYKDDLIVIGVSIEENISKEKLLEFRKQYNANYTLVASSRNRALADTIVKELKLGDRYPIPIMALYKDGKYINHYIGAIEEEFIDSDIKRSLGK